MDINMESPVVEEGAAGNGGQGESDELEELM
jgi:hypothetical protein